MRRNTAPPTREQMLLVQEIYERHRAVIYKYAMARTRDAAEADDAVSEALLRLFRNADKLRDMCDGEIVDYTVKTVLSAAADIGRRSKAEQKRLRALDESDSELPDPEPGPEEHIAEREAEKRTYRHLQATLDELRESDRVLLIGKYLEDRSDEELAQLLGVKASSIRMKLTRARMRAKRIMERKEGGDA